MHPTVFRSNWKIIEESDSELAELKVLFVTSEVAPLIKTGGLADVSSALPAALRAMGLDVHVLVPGYNQVIAQLMQYEVAAVFDNLPGFPSSRLLSSRMMHDVPLLVLDCPSLYQRDGGPYQDVTGHDWADNALRFGLLSKVAAVLGSSASPLGWHPDLVHCNDWQTGLTPAYLHFAQGAVPSIIAIHNLAFQGIFPPETVAQLGLPSSCFSIDGVEYYGNMSFLKAGLFYADHITTVSPNYAKEIQQKELGFGLQGLLSMRSGDLTGMLNGIDTEEWDPETDPHLARQYSGADMTGKSANKKALQIKLGLKTDPNVPLLGVVSRFTHQKGLDLLLEIAPRLTELPAQLVMLGNGDAHLQKTARDLSHRYPGMIGAVIGFSEDMSHQIEAGADMFVMPSRFEPCGLNQLYSQRYGTPPIVHATGGLSDSVVDCTSATLKDGTASGFMFDGMTAENLFITIQRAIGLYHDKIKWETLCKNCMAKNFSWHSSAEACRAVYLKVLERSAEKT
ncbi:MAG: glycogen synthase GlgA [Gallionella sp.]|nr:glycogen synthase GlgA [Gallionella sp.]